MAKALAINQAVFSRVQVVRIRLAAFMKDQFEERTQSCRRIFGWVISTFFCDDVGEALWPRENMHLFRQWGYHELAAFHSLHAADPTIRSSHTKTLKEAPVVAEALSV